MPVTKTSKESYNTDIKDCKEVTQSELVYNTLDKLGGTATINEIYREIGVLPSTVSARLNKLLKDNRVYKTGKKIKDNITNKSNELWPIR